jgi:hypothetical protein
MLDLSCNSSIGEIPDFDRCNPWCLKRRAVAFCSHVADADLWDQTPWLTGPFSRPKHERSRGFVRFAH